MLILLVAEKRKVQARMRGTEDRRERLRVSALAPCRLSIRLSCNNLETDTNFAFRFEIDREIIAFRRFAAPPASLGDLVVTSFP